MRGQHADGERTAARKRPKTSKPDPLNARQHTYLLAALEIDQHHEHLHALAFRRGSFEESRRPASDWRAMPFGRFQDVRGCPPTPLRQECGGADEGSGSTWAALERRGLVTVAERQPHGALGDSTLPHVTLTPKGRRLARELKGETVQPKLRGVLARSTWAALAAAWQAGPAGLRDDGGGWYGDMPWDTWLLLRNRRGGDDLVEEFSVREPSPRQGDPGHHERVSFLRLTERGRAFYAERWAVNQAAHPEVDAPSPLEVTP